MLTKLLGGFFVMKIMYKNLFFILSLLLLFASCATGGKSDNGTVLLDQAIQKATENIETNVSPGQKIALLNFTSTSEQFSVYVLDELTDRLVNGKKFTVVDRNELDLIRKEMNFQMSGEVSDESMQAIGKMLGAQVIVSGSLSETGSVYRFRIRVLRVETAAIEASSSSDINKRERKVVSLLARKNSSSKNEQAVSQDGIEKNYRIGDMGPAGGFVFYDKGVVSDGWRYLEAAPQETEASAGWRLVYGTEIMGTVTVVGGGKRNTPLINEKLKNEYSLYPKELVAVKVCVELTFNGYKDWFLPSLDELDFMYKNLAQRGLGGFNKNEYYWSSSLAGRGGGGDIAWSQHFGDGSKDQGNVYSDYFLVRAVRAF